MSQASRRRGNKTLQVVHESQPQEGKQQADVSHVVSLPSLLSIPQVAKTLCLGRTKVYELIATEGLPVYRFGRAVRMSPVALKRWLEQREQVLSM